MNYYNNDYDRGYTEATMSAADYMARTYRWMACGLVVTFAVALLTVATPLFYLVNSLYLVLTIAELALVFTLSARLQRMSVGAARGVFLAYSALNGMVLSYYFLLFSVNTLVMAFLSTAVYFGLMAFYGHTTNRDLTSWGPKLMMGLMAMLITGLVGTLFGFGNTIHSFRNTFYRSIVCTAIQQRSVAVLFTVQIGLQCKDIVW